MVHGSAVMVIKAMGEVGEVGVKVWENRKARARTGRLEGR